jgi:WbqC-like protein family
MTSLAVMQPYLLPYIGYFQLIGAVDVFVVYDNIKYTKKGWINRNRMLRDGKDVLFSLPLKGDSDSLNIAQRELATNFSREKLLNQFIGVYRRAPHFARTFPLIEQVVHCPETNLFRFLHYSIFRICQHLGMETEIRKSSDIDIDHGLRAQDKVLAVCSALGATKYLNSQGGVALYDREAFLARGIELKFIRPIPYLYQQFGAPFVPWLSIIDMLMFVPLDEMQKIVHTHCEIF